MRHWLCQHFIKLGAVGGILGILLFFGFVLPGFSALQEKGQEIKGLKQQLNMLEQFRKQGDFDNSVKELQEQYAQLSVLIRDQVDMSALGETLQQQANSNGVVMKELRRIDGMDRKPIKGLRRHTMELLVCGEYEALLLFLKQLEQQKLQPENLRFNPHKEGREIQLGCRICIYELSHGNT